MIKGLKTYGSDKLVKELPKLENPIFICTIATTKTSEIPGLTGAGATPELTKYTPAGDAELILSGKVMCMDDIPQTIIGEVVTPTPSVIAKASVELADTAKMIIDAGSEIKANVDVFDISDGNFGGDISTGKAVKNPEAIFNKAYDLATILSEKHDYIVIGESLAAGTTTALGVLVGLGYDAKGKVSGCMDTNPHSLKNRLVDEGLANANITPSKDNDPFEVVAAVGDAMLPAVAGVIMGATVPVVLAGGTQLTAACAIVRAIDKNFDFSNTCLSTTAYVVADETADLLDIAKQIGGITVNAVDPFFEDSTVEGLKNYTKGFIKEGAGAGGAMFLALMRGHSIESIRTAIEKEALK
ncbi:MAG: TIGR00303 family protein [archaeon]|nr:TIGR00303 family protein [archaeon]